MSVADLIRTNVKSIRSRIAAALDRAGRAPDSVRLVCVTKYAEMDWVRELVAQGEADLGESRPQQLGRRAQEMPSSVRWHMIGHLQRNKVESVLDAGCLIHSVDSPRLLQRIAEVSLKSGRRPQLLLEVNVSGEDSKDGFSVDGLRSFWPECLKLVEQVQIQGLMTMAPAADDPESARPWFRRLRELRDDLVATSNGRVSLPELSMGMSGDFEVAIEEGATLVRIGSSLFTGLAAG